MVQQNLQTRPGSSRQVSFLGKCQVILPIDYPTGDVVEDYFSRKNSSKTEKSKRRLPLFRSKKNRSWSESAHEQDRQKRVTSPPPQGYGHRSNSAPLGASSLSPSLPISRDGTANRLRQKLVSPPPPTSEEPQSPVAGLRLPTPSTSINHLPVQATSPSSSPSFVKAPMARPVAVRKPLTFGFDKDEENSQDARAKLQCPPIIYVSNVSKQQSDDVKKADVKPSVLDWKDDADESTSPSSSGDLDDEDDEEVWDEPQYEEEDLHGECTCLDCEQKMIEALSPGYQPQWTRGARRKYLADRKEAQNEQSRKAVRPPIWLTSEESETAAAASPVSETMTLPFSPPSKLREICADEVDNKKGILRTESVTKKEGIDSTAGQSAGTGAIANALSGLDDATLRREVDEEVRLREEEHRQKKTRSEMRKLSADLGSGLRVGGGGARAMMRQLEEAEQAERRARFERSRSPKHLEEQAREEAIPIGAALASTSTPPPRLASPMTIEQIKPAPPAALSTAKDKPSRTPSPLKRALSLGKSTEAKTPSSSSTPKNEVSVEPTARHPSPSLLIRRELALGIPVQSNASINGKGKQSWHNSPKSGSPAIEPTKLHNNSPSPRLTALNEPIKKIDSSGEASKIDTVPKTGMTRSRSMQPSTSLTSRKSRDDQPKRISNVDSAAQDDIDVSNGKGGAAPSLRRSNTTGSRSAVGTSKDTPAFSTAPLASSPHSNLSSSNAALHASHSAHNLVEARLDKAKAKARSSFRDLVARIKG